VGAIRIRDYRSSELEDSLVIERIIAGENELFEILLRRYNQTLYRVIRGYLKDQDDVQDAMQNVYLKAFDKLSQFKGHSSFSTWLIRIGINEALRRVGDIKKDKVIYPNTIQENKTEFGNHTPDKQMNPEKAIIYQESQQLLEKAIDNLPEKYRLIYILKEVEGLDNLQIQESLGLTESNTKVRLHRARTLLKRSLYKFSLKEEVFEFGKSRCDAVVALVMKDICAIT
jgi:RNA polymerase sigma factor (sigma-70 family)